MPKESGDIGRRVLLRSFFQENYVGDDLTSQPFWGAKTLKATFRYIHLIRPTPEFPEFPKAVLAGNYLPAKEDRGSGQVLWEDSVHAIMRHRPGRDSEIQERAGQWTSLHLRRGGKAPSGQIAWGLNFLVEEILSIQAMLKIMSDACLAILRISWPLTAGPKITALTNLISEQIVSYRCVCKRKASLL